MKRITLLAVLVAVAVHFEAQSQTTFPDGEFENCWDYFENPTPGKDDYWDFKDNYFLSTLNQLHELSGPWGDAPLTVFRLDGSDVYQGNYSLKLVSNTMILGGETIFLPGVAATMEVDVLSIGCVLGEPFTYSPKNIKGYYQYFPVNGDSAAIEIWLQKNGTVLGGGKQIIKNSVPNWTEFIVPISYTSNDTPDTIVVIFTASADYDFTSIVTLMQCKGQVGSTLYIDDVKFEYDYIPKYHYSATICQGETYNDDNFTNLTEAGIYYDTLQNINGDDSIVCLTLTESLYVFINYFATFCQGGTYSDDYFSNLTKEGFYCDTLQVVNGCDSVVCLTLTYSVTPMQQQLCMISVDENYHNELVWKQKTEVASYNIYREGNVSGQYEIVANIDYNSPNIWVDTTSNASIRPYCYKISGIDICGNESELSDVHKTMHLQIGAGMNNSWNLSWTAYEGTQYSTYNIWRATGDTLTLFEPIETMSSGNTTYTDHSAPAGYVYYIVEIVLDEPCVLTKTLSSIKSNIATNNPSVSIVETDNYPSLPRIYPNPAKDKLFIECESFVTIKIYDILGKEILIQNANGKTEIDISHLPNGIYSVQILSEDKVVGNSKVVKE